MISQYLPEEIIKLIRDHLYVMIIQRTFKSNRPMTLFKEGDRILVCNNTKKIYYAIIINVLSNSCYIKFLPKLIPNWKKCNKNFWKNYNETIYGHNIFPYYIPRYIIVNNKYIIKLNNL